MARSRISTVFFDVGGTILTVRRSVGEIYAEAAARLGHRVEAARVNANFRKAWQRSLARRAAAGHRCTDAMLKADWGQIVVDSFAGLLPEETARRAFDDLYERFCRPDAWDLAEGAEAAFEELRADGFRLGILSNWDSRLEDTLESVGIRDHFEHFVVSHSVGVEKPHPRIFHEALRQAGAGPHQIVHVGDSFEWDVEPAMRLGIHVLWLRGDAAGLMDDERPEERLAASGNAGEALVQRVHSVAEVPARVRALAATERGGGCDS